jgi:hypothetical protein
MQSLHPVGSIYINATNATNPGTLLGFGTWAAFGAGRVPVGFNAANALFDTAEETGGYSDSTLPTHTHLNTISDPGHAHTTPVYNAGGGNGSLNGYGNALGANISTSTVAAGVTITNVSEGSSGVDKNYQPYITVYMWKRTA